MKGSSAQSRNAIQSLGRAIANTQFLLTRVHETFFTHPTKGNIHCSPLEPLGRVHQLEPVHFAICDQEAEDLGFLRGESWNVHGNILHIVRLVRKHLVPFVFENGHPTVRTIAGVEASTSSLRRTVVSPCSRRFWRMTSSSRSRRFSVYPAPTIPTRR